MRSGRWKSIRVVLKIHEAVRAHILKNASAPSRRPARRKKGTPNKVTSAVNEILQSGILLGDRIKEVELGANPEEKAERRANFSEGGMLGYLKWLALNRPDVFFGMLKKLLPKAT